MGLFVEYESTLAQDWAAVCVDVADEGCVGGVRDALKLGESQAKLAHKYKSRTGELERKTEGRITEVTRFGASGELKADTPYASYVEKGTKPHEIRPKLGKSVEGPLAPSQSRSRSKAGKQMLHWVDSGGDDHFALSVEHPGTDPMPFLEPTIPLMERTINHAVERATENAQRHMK